MSKNKIIAGRWKVIKKIGNGGQGEVYKVFDSEDPSSIYALKLLIKQNDRERRARMHHEVNNVKLLNNNHLIDIIDTNSEFYEKDDEKLYYVSTYVKGCTLESYCQSNNVSLSDALKLFEDILNVVSYCHEKDILHRDIKPENILLNEDRLSKFVLIDFGLSFNNSDDEHQETCTFSDQQLGNRFLLLPELVAGDKHQKRLKCSDITQVCGVFFYVLTGIIPNTLVDGEGNKPHQRPKAIEIINNKISDPTVRKNITYIFDKCFDPKTGNRYHEVGELLEILKTISEPRVTDKGGNIMNDNFQLTQAEVNDTFRYSELITILNPTPELLNPSGMQLPLMTDIGSLVPYAIAIPDKTRSKIVDCYKKSDFETSAEKIWHRAITVLRKRVLSLGEEFVADMVEIDDADYLQNLPPYTLICLAHELGFIDKSGKQKLLYSNDIFNHYAGNNNDEYEEMPQDEANIVIKNCIAYILCYDADSFGWQMNDFRDKLKSGRITELYEDVDTMFLTSPYFYLKTTVRSLLNLFRETEDIEFENVAENMTILFPAIWDNLKFEERRALADTYEYFYSKNDSAKTKSLTNIMLKVKGFDYVAENTRSRTFIRVANRLKSAHFEIDNFYNEPIHIKKLESLGTKIPNLALKECLTAIIYVKIGNNYGFSWDAQTYADKLLARITVEQWTTYLESYLKYEIDLVNYIKNSQIIRKRWKELVKDYKLKDLNIVDVTAKSIL